MLSGYYKLWVDAITLAKKRNGETGNWKLLTLIPISIIQGVNLFTILLLIRALSHKETLVLMPVGIFNLRPLDIFCSILITYLVPFMLLNYLLIFSNEQYERLLKMYHDKDGKLYLWYIYISLGIIIIPFVFKFIF